jgi:hypothetical protein
VFTLRCTARLLSRLRESPSGAVANTTTRLGDWYANLLRIGRVQLVLAISERTFLPVVVPAAPSATLVPRLRARVRELLGALDVDDTHVERELIHMQDVAFGKTASRQVTGVMIDLAKGLEFYLEGDPSLLGLSLKLAETPCSPLYKTETSPDRATLALFAAP